MQYALASLLTDVGDNTIAVHALLLGNFGNDFKNMSHHSAVVSVHFGHRTNMRFGNHQKVSGRLRRNVVKRVAQFVLIDLAARNIPGNDLTE